VKEFKIVVGLEIGSDFLRAAEVEHREDRFFLSRVAETKLLSLDTDELVQKISLLVNEEGILGRIASVSVDTTLTERDTIELDDDLQSQEIANFLKAEINLHSDFEGREYRPAYEITKSSGNGYNEVFYAALEKSLLSFVKDACTRCGLDLQYIDIDHSCSELTVNKLQPKLRTCILVTVKNKQIEGSFIKNGERIVYRYLSYSGEPFYFVTKMARDLETLAKKYAEKIFVTGTAADNFLIQLLQKNADKRYELLVPTQDLLLSPIVSSNTKLKTAPHHFSSVIGAAIK